VHLADPAGLRRAEKLLDEANSLTHTEVLLDERANERWLVQLADIRQRAEDPATPAAERETLVALLRRLEDLGM
jgi:hypothetical protein